MSSTPHPTAPSLLGSASPTHWGGEDLEDAKRISASLTKVLLRGTDVMKPKGLTTPMPRLPHEPDVPKGLTKGVEHGGRSRLRN